MNIPIGLMVGFIGLGRFMRHFIESLLIYAYEEFNLVRNVVRVSKEQTNDKL